MNQIQKKASGNNHIRLPVYLPEALVTQPASRTNSPAPQLPTLTATFNVIGVSQRPNSETKRLIRIFVGSDTLRAYSADILFSQNVMTLYGDDRNRLSVPFVRPEDETLFKNLCTTVVAPEKVELEATAPPFTPIEQKLKDSASINATGGASAEIFKSQADQLSSRSTTSVLPTKTPIQVLENLEPQKQLSEDGAKQFTTSNLLLADDIYDSQAQNISCNDDQTKEPPTNYDAVDTSVTDSERRESPGSIWGTWRTGGFSNNDSDTNREHISTSSYQRPSRGGRNMKVLKPSKTSQRGRSSSAAHTGASYEPPIQRISGEFRRKIQAGASENNGPIRWEASRTVSDEKTTKDSRAVTSVSRSSNPIGGATAFSWMNHGQAITTSARAE
jgi:hypothetical protein